MLRLVRELNRHKHFQLQIAAVVLVPFDFLDIDICGLCELSGNAKLQVRPYYLKPPIGQSRNRRRVDGNVSRAARSIYA